MAQKHIDQNGSWVIAVLITIGIGLPLGYAFTASTVTSKRNEEISAHMKNAIKGYSGEIKSQERERSSYSWGYEGANGPKNWADLSNEFYKCRTGEQQSPVNLSSNLAIREKHSIKLKYDAAAATMKQHSTHLSINYDQGNTFIVDEKVFSLQKMTIHTPSEHTVDGKHQDLELQFHHRSPTGKRATVSVFAKKGKFNSEIDKIAQNFPEGEGKEKVIKSVEVANLLPHQRSYFHYRGSMTQPPCSEGVQWFVLKQPIDISETNFEKIVSTIKFNARPVQSLNKRVIKLSTLNVN